MRFAPPLMTLPGAQRRIAAVVADLKAGRNCVVLLPDVLVDSDIADDIGYDIAARVKTLRVPPPEVNVADGTPPPAATALGRSPGPRPSWAVNRFGVLGSATFTTAVAAASPRHKVTTTLAERMATLLTRPPEGADPLAEVVAAQELRGAVLVVRAWKEPDPGAVGAMAVRFAAMTKDSPVPLEERVRLLILTRDRNIPAGALERLDPVTSAVHWWWGVLGRLDTTVVVAAAEATAGRGDPVGLRSTLVADYLFRDLVTEIAGPDLELATHLTYFWDGRMSALPELVTGYASSRKPELAVPDATRHGRPTRPPMALRDAWNHGLADLWDGEIRMSPLAEEPSAVTDRLDQHLWRGQNRALTPVIDQLRAAMEDRVRSIIGAAGVDALLARDGESQRSAARQITSPVLEVGRMAVAVKTGELRVNDAERKLIYCLRDVRNSLAHLVALDDSTLSRLAQTIANSPVRGR
jgi:hypothetical protein